MLRQDWPPPSLCSTRSGRAGCRGARQTRWSRSSCGKWCTPYSPTRGTSAGALPTAGHAPAEKVRCRSSTCLSGSFLTLGKRSTRNLKSRGHFGTWAGFFVVCRSDKRAPALFEEVVAHLRSQDKRSSDRSSRNLQGKEETAEHQ